MTRIRVATSGPGCYRVLVSRAGPRATDRAGIGPHWRKNLMLWRVLVGGVVVFGAGVAAAAPPGLQPGPHADGRELDPVARDHFLTDAPVAPAEPGEGPSAAGDGPGALWAFVTAAHAAVLDELTIPLGTARAEAM